MAQMTGFNRTHLGALFRLRGKLTLRQFSRQKGRLVIALLVIFLVAPLTVGAGIGTAVGYRTLPDQWPTALMGGVLVVLWGIWLLFPIFVGTINEGADITRLLIYPLSRRDLITSVLLGTLFDYPTYLMLPLFVAIVIGFGLGPVLPVVLVALLLSYAHLVIISQLIMTAVGGILQSRRVRDVTIVLASLLGGSCYFLNLGFQRLAENLTSRLNPDQVEATVVSIQPLNTLQWFPTGAAARAIERASVGEWGVSLVWLGYTAVLLAIITWAWYRLLVRLTTGEGFLFSPKPEEKKEEKKVTTRRERDLFSWLPDDVAEMARKELKLVWRIPQRRVGIIQGIIFPFIMVGAFVFGASDISFELPAGVGLGLPLYALFLFWITTQNMMVWEGKGMPTLLLTPIPRERIFWAKGFILALVTATPYVLLGSIVIFITRSWVSAAGLITGVCMGVASMAVTAVTSVLFPIPINIEARTARRTLQSGGNFKAGCASITVVPIGIALVSFPAALPLIIAYLLDLAWIGILGTLLSAAYAVAIFWVGSRVAGNYLLEREPEFLAALKLPDED